MEGSNRREPDHRLPRAGRTDGRFWTVRADRRCGSQSCITVTQHASAGCDCRPGSIIRVITKRECVLVRPIYPCRQLVVDRLMLAGSAVVAGKSRCGRCPSPELCVLPLPKTCHASIVTMESSALRNSCTQMAVLTGLTIKRFAFAKCCTAKALHFCRYRRSGFTTVRSACSASCYLCHAFTHRVPHESSCQPFPQTGVGRRR